MFTINHLLLSLKSQHLGISPIVRQEVIKRDYFTQEAATEYGHCDRALQFNSPPIQLLFRLPCSRMRFLLRLQPYRRTCIKLGRKMANFDRTSSCAALFGFELTEDARILFPNRFIFSRGSALLRVFGLLLFLFPRIARANSQETMTRHLTRS